MIYSGTKKSIPQSGSALIYIVVVMVIAGILGVAMSSLFSVSTIETASSDCQTKARYMATAGLRYAFSQVNATHGDALSGNYTLSDGQNFSLSITNGSTNASTTIWNISSVGSACQGSAMSSIAVSGRVFIDISSDGEEISFEDDIDNFFVVGGYVDNDPSGTDPATSPIVIHRAEKEVVLGNNQKESGGCLWYGGNLEACENGTCEFGGGVRAYFDIQFTPQSKGDGFVFAVKSNATNEFDSCGGDNSMGELLSYAGASPLEGYDGIQPPKMGVEFDVYSNRGSGSEIGAGSRKDPTNRDHVAAVYWGDLDDVTFNGNSNGRNWGNVSVRSNTYDDNRHGEGSGLDEPENPDNLTQGVYYPSSGTSAWLKDGSVWHVRIEMQRETVPRYNPATNGFSYRYVTKTWLQDSEVSQEFQNLSKDYKERDPELSNAIDLHFRYHDVLDYVIAGFTEATGAATQLATLSKFKMRFQSDRAWETGRWSKRKKISFNPGTPLDNYQLYIHHIPYDSDMKPDFSDLRFTDQSGTKLRYWIERIEPEQWANVWVKVASSGTKDIMMYYANENAQTTSNGKETFEFFADMSAGTPWRQYGNGQVEIDENTFEWSVAKKTGWLLFSNDPNGGYLELGTEISDYRLLVRDRRIDFLGGNWNRYGLEDTQFDGYSLKKNVNSNGNNFGFERRDNGDPENDWVDSVRLENYDWYINELRKSGKKFEAILYDDQHDNELMQVTENNEKTYPGPFSRFVVHGGHEYVIDWVAIAKNSNKPFANNITFGNEENIE
jgi:hypothetical protein